LPPGFERERALRRRFDELLLTSPVMAADWLNQLPAPDRSVEMVERLSREWLRENPAAAKQWLDQNVTSPELRRQILREARP
jgi:hypothetical protein